MRVDEFISRLEQVSNSSNGQYTALCPAHEDQQPSLSVGEGDDHRLLLKCHAGCTTEEIVAAMSLTMLDLFPEQSGKPTGLSAAAKTVKPKKTLKLEALAQDKKLPVDFLKSIGVLQVGDIVGIPYFMSDGAKAPRHRRRSALKASDRGSTWTGNKRSGEIVPYGLWKLKSAAAAQYLIIVEGESDCWTLWYHGFPALGVPGAQMTKTLMAAAPQMEAIQNILIVAEPDTAGSLFPENVHRTLQDAGWQGKAYTLFFTKESKDPNALHQALGGDKDRFKKNLVERMQQAKLRAAPRPVIEVGNQQLYEMTEQALSALKNANDPPTLFVRSGGLCRVCRDENARALLDVVNRAKLRNRLAQVGTFLVIGEKVTRSVLPPDKLVENILAEGKWSFPPLMSVNAAPILRPDGTVTSTPGYDKMTRSFYAPTPGLQIPEIPDNPTDAECAEALQLLLDLFQDFPFADQASRANALAMLFSVLLRPAISGNIPLGLIEAPVQGTGKTLLAAVISVLATGVVCVQTVPTRQDEDEWRKRITAILLAGSPLALLDNLPEAQKLDSATLAAVLTSDSWTDRILGRSETVTLAVRTVWMATGNNIRVSGDMPRRCYCVRLDANAEKPWERSGFRHPDLAGYVKENRGKLLAAAFTLVRAWYVSGRPPAPTRRSFGSFQDWVDVLGGVLAHAEVEGFLDNLDEVRAVQDSDTEQWQAFFAAWWTVLGEQAVTTETLCQRVISDGFTGMEILPDILLSAQEKGVSSLKRSLGRHLSRLAGRVFAGRKLVSGGQDRIKKVRKWKLSPMLPETESEVTGGYSDGENEESSPFGDKGAGVSGVIGGLYQAPIHEKSNVSKENTKHVCLHIRGGETTPANPANPRAADSAGLGSESGYAVPEGRLCQNPDHQRTFQIDDGLPVCGICHQPPSPEKAIWLEDHITSPTENQERETIQEKIPWLKD